jgi:hypothetical protein
VTLRDSIQVILKWVGGGTKLNLSKTPNADRDILKAIVLKLQKRVEAGAGTFISQGQLVEDCKDHRSKVLLWGQDKASRRVTEYGQGAADRHE